MAISETVAGRANPFSSASEVLVAFSKWPIGNQKSFDFKLNAFSPPGPQNISPPSYPTCKTRTLQNSWAPWRWTILSCSFRPDLFCKYVGWLLHIKGGSRAVIRRSAYGVFCQLGESIGLICFTGRSRDCSANTGTSERGSSGAVSRVREIRRLLSCHWPFPKASARQKSENPAASIIMIMAIIIIFIVLFIKNYSELVVSPLRKLLFLKSTKLGLMV